MDAGGTSGWEGPDIRRWDWIRPIRGRNWHMRIVWVAHDEKCDPPLTGGTAWFSFGPEGEQFRTFQRDLDAVTPDVTNHFTRLVTRFAEAL